MSETADSSPDVPTPDATGPDGGTSEPSHQHLLPVGHHLLPFGLGREILHPHDDVLVEFSVGGGFGAPGHSRHLTMLQSGTAIVDSGRRIRRRAWTLSRPRLEQLQSALVQARFWSLLSRYGVCHDCSSYSITYAGLTVQVRVVTWEPDVIPKRLAPVLSLLTRLAYTPRIR